MDSWRHFAWIRTLNNQERCVFFGSIPDAHERLEGDGKEVALCGVNFLAVQRHYDPAFDNQKMNIGVGVVLRNLLAGLQGDLHDQKVLGVDELTFSDLAVSVWNVREYVFRLFAACRGQSDRQCRACYCHDSLHVGSFLVE